MQPQSKVVFRLPTIPSSALLGCASPALRTYASALSVASIPVLPGGPSTLWNIYCQNKNIWAQEDLRRKECKWSSYRQICQLVASSLELLTMCTCWQMPQTPLPRVVGRTCAVIAACIFIILKLLPVETDLFISPLGLLYLWSFTSCH